jgi:hypothetical protein
MSILDFIKNRQTQQQSAAPQTQPETAKQMYAREATQDKAAAKSLSQLPADQKSKLAEVRTELQSHTIGQAPSANSLSSAPADATANPQPMRQASMQQDNAAPALSPTTAQAAARESEKPSVAPSQTKSQEQAKTMARRPLSWER